MRAVLTALAAVPYVLGWTAGAVAVVAAWSWAALVAGWRDGRRVDGPAEPVPARRPWAAA
ncbi:hypothetical protein SAMN04489713_104267 [Actinomadura madurae]|uniref:Uncharacterized protein n=1 Tax=Actinomadura madurae TaxID=1993 RepID=A0A1I5ET50_9ACTN|nr:hypothetical protein [Actinomadura madurae]SFO14560.1 hypothetical protein SAMN04489713_104267 [Actinomadura madurae]